MRLTLRTLLAYLDDILEPAQTKEIGSKLAESSFAKLLSNRIRDVMRRRRLGAPAVGESVDGVDANAVAEYLDNTLPAERVADIEKVCLENDAYLAEAAACHQVLTLVLGEPVEIRTECRERMYALKAAVEGPDAAATAESTYALSDSQTESPKSDATATAKHKRASKKRPVPAESSKTVVKIPDYLAHRSLWRRAVPIIIALVVAGVWVGLIVIDPAWRNMLLPGLSTAGKNGVPAPEPSAQELALKDGKKGTESAAATSQDAAGGTQAATVNAAPAAIPADPQPPPDEADEGTKSKPPTTVASKSDTADDKKGTAPPAGKGAEPGKDDARKVASVEPKPAEMKKPAETSPPTKSAAPSAGAPKPASQETILYTSPEGLLAHLTETGAAAGWYLVPHRSEVFFNEQLACPEPFDAALQIKNKPCRLVLDGGTSVRVTPGDDKTAFGIEIREGRVAIERTDAADAASNGPISVGVTVDGERWQLALTQPATLCGIEIVPEQPDEYEKPPAGNRYQGLLCVAKGAVGFEDGKGLARQLAEKNRLSLTPSDRAQEAEAKDETPSAKLADMPRWLDFDAERPTSATSRTIRQFEDGFNLHDVLDDSMPALYEDRQPKVAELAVKTLAITENHALMVKALEKTEHEEARLAAINGLRNWLGRDPGNGALLKADLATMYREDDAQTVYELLWGFKKESAYDLATSLKLVDLLKHNQLVVRELAFYHIYRMTGRKGEYRPHLSPQQINVIAARMRRDVERDKGLLRR